ncbi:hypothetical protein SKAU_G00272710 [Synaphobranchus kaupii]|uniref:Uncharacterized protein n=1 Tax=Synaphobranchus kaupii TaxID=118154 RepID=A0A9Q1F0K3_SYNKA|nr:hypothetical protein SKAU_G00272710 [Synaphobranchus kaupii]
MTRRAATLSPDWGQAQAKKQPEPPLMESQQVERARPYLTAAQGTGRITISPRGGAALSGPRRGVAATLRPLRPSAGPEVQTDGHVGEGRAFL